jgi:hypothetical protein
MTLSHGSGNKHFLYHIGLCKYAKYHMYDPTPCTNSSAIINMTQSNGLPGTSTDVNTSCNSTPHMVQHAQALIAMIGFTDILATTGRPNNIIYANSSDVAPCSTAQWLSNCSKSDLAVCDTGRLHTWRSGLKSDTETSSLHTQQLISDGGSSRCSLQGHA